MFFLFIAYIYIMRLLRTFYFGWYYLLSNVGMLFLSCIFGFCISVVLGCFFIFINVFETFLPNINVEEVSGWIRETLRMIQDRIVESICEIFNNIYAQLFLVETYLSILVSLSLIVLVVHQFVDTSVIDSTNGSINSFNFDDKPLTIPTLDYDLLNGQYKDCFGNSVSIDKTEKEILDIYWRCMKETVGIVIFEGGFRKFISTFVKNSSTEDSKEERKKKSCRNWRKAKKNAKNFAHIKKNQNRTKPLAKF